MIRTSAYLIAATLVVAVPTAVLAQERAAEQGAEQRSTEGTVTSVGRGSMVVRTDQGGFMVFAVTPDTRREQPVEPGTRVRVVTMGDDIDDARTALAVDVLPPRQGLAPQTNDPVPPAVRRLESQIERAARRFRAGLKAGAALDPELITVDAFATFAPMFTPGVSFRPNIELAFGELTTLIGLHADVLYMLPGLSRARWAPYIGAGPNFSFSHRGLEEDTGNLDVDDDRIDDALDDDNGRFDFDDYDWNTGFNFIVGARNPNGVFFEMKSTAWGAANVRMLAGFEF